VILDLQVGQDLSGPPAILHESAPGTNVTAATSRLPRRARGWARVLRGRVRVS
jgi:hypothetical protein